jgi:hypothetical protein
MRSGGASLVKLRHILGQKLVNKSKRQFAIRHSAPNSHGDTDRLEAVANQAIAACGGDALEAVKALIVASDFSRLRSQSYKPPFQTATRP